MSLQAGISITANIRPLQNISERTADEDEQIRSNNDDVANRLRVAMPCEIIEFYPETCTADLQPLVREKMIDRSTGETRWEKLPVLPGVPVQFMGGGGFYVTTPVKPGDEAMVIFNDTSIESWFKQGGIQNWVDKRRHSLS